MKESINLEEMKEEYKHMYDYNLDRLSEWGKESTNCSYKKWEVFERDK